MSIITLIAAKAKNDVIGLHNRLPWHLPEDLKHFKETTLNHPIIMGRQTFESIGKPLPNRTNIVVSRQNTPAHPDVIMANSLEDALRHCVGEHEIFVIGGAQLYTYALPCADKLILTEIDQDFLGDAFFPTIQWQEWREVARTSGVSASPEAIPYAFVTYLRK